MFRRLLCKWFGLLDPRAEPPATLRDVEPFSPTELASLVASACEHPGAKYLIDVAHNHRVAYEREQELLTRNIPQTVDAEALVRRLCYLDGAVYENRWFERQIEIAQEQLAQSAQAGQQVSGASSPE